MSRIKVIDLQMETTYRECKHELVLTHAPSLHNRGCVSPLSQALVVSSGLVHTLERYFFTTLSNLFLLFPNLPQNGKQHKRSQDLPSLIK